MLFDGVVLFIAGFLGGVMNSLAGGGSFITFPALMLIGIPPVSANATNTFASCAGYLSGAYALRKDIASDSKNLAKIVILSLLGGVVGAWLLLRTPESVFMEAIPWLLLFATLLFIYGGVLSGYLRRLSAEYKHASVLGGVLLSLFLLFVSIYGGFFNAGLGIVCLSYLSLAGYQNINVMNGIKLLISSCVALVAIALFIWEGAIDWPSGAVVMLGTLLGGFVAAKLSRNLSQSVVRGFVTITSIGITFYFFYDVYFAV